MDWNPSRNKGITDWSMRDNRNGFIDKETSAYVQKLFQQTHHNGINFENYFAIPIDISDTAIPQMNEFSDCEVHPSLLDNLKRFGYSKPTPVQQYAIPVSLLRRDLMACAQTGSGKTAAYLYPMVAKMLQDGPPPPVSQSDARPLALILAPTRELSVQIYEETLKFTYLTGIRAVVVYGGASVDKQHNQLIQGADIIIATPGRLIDFIERRVINLYITRYLILDEADRMLDMGFEPQLIRILTAIKKTDRETIMCSATFPLSIQTIAKKYLRDYVYLTVGRVGSTTENIIQKLHLVKHYEKQNFLVGLIGELEGQILVFVEKKASANDLNMSLGRQGIKCTCIHGDRVQAERERALNDFKNNNVRILIATDVASRGLDIPNVACVIVYDLPSNIDSYVHRIGRTGRIGNTGVAIAFVDDRAGPILPDLLLLLEESKQEVPDWFRNMANGNGNVRAEDYSSSSQSRSGGNYSVSGYQGGNQEKDPYSYGINNQPMYAGGPTDYSNSYSKPIDYPRGNDFGKPAGYQSGSSYSGRGGNSDYQRGGYDNQRGNFGGDRGGYDNKREEYGGRGGYNNARGGYNNQYGGYEDRRGSSNYRKSSNEPQRGSNEYSRGTNEYGRGNNEYGRGNNEYGRGNNEYGRGNNEYGRGGNSYGRGNYDYGRGSHEEGSNNYGRGGRAGYSRGDSNYQGSYSNNRGQGRGSYENNYSDRAPEANDWAAKESGSSFNSAPSNYSRNNYSSNPDSSNPNYSGTTNRRWNGYHDSRIGGRGRDRGGQDYSENSYSRGNSRPYQNYSTNQSSYAADSDNWGIEPKATDDDAWGCVEAPGDAWGGSNAAKPAASYPDKQAIQSNPPPFSNREADAWGNIENNTESKNYSSIKAPLNENPPPSASIELPKSIIEEDPWAEV